MQNNVTEITQKLLGALDSDYNVTNMAAIIEVITLLEKVAITKEMLETTRLGKHINELRKHIANDALAKRAKLLVKKWRNIVLVANPEPAATNGQVRAAAAPLDEGGGGKRRPPSRLEAPAHPKRHRANGTALPFDYDFSDNSNSSFKDAVGSKTPALLVVNVNSDSNSSTSAQEAPAPRDHPYEELQQPKKRGRKKGSKNHKNLIEEAESSFSNKMAVSRGNAKVKTTQELIESLQNKSLPPCATTPVSPARTADDWRERAAKLTERVSLIDQKLNSGGNRLKKHRSGGNNNLTPPMQHFPPDDDDDDEIIVVDDMPAKHTHRKRNASPEEPQVVVVPVLQVLGPASLSEEEALSRLPPIDFLDADDPDAPAAACACWCVLEESQEEAPPEYQVHAECPARARLEETYRLKDVGGERVALLHASCAEGLNGNFGAARLQSDPPPSAERQDAPADANIVPTFYQLPAKSAACSETYKKYSISEGDAAPGGDAFREYHECLDRPSYGGNTLRILPYVIID